MSNTAVSVRDTLIRQAAEKSACHYDEVVRSAILRVTGKDHLVMADVARLGVLKVMMASGTEVFAYDGVDLVEFFPMTFETVQDGVATKLVVSRKYRVL
ncbi:MAG: hypothetical protein GY767_22325 [Shimia sp.]|nr:hypothetical protein [Shimia sp.]